MKSANRESLGLYRGAEGRQAGFTLITALFLLVVVAGLSVYMITIRNVQQSTVVFAQQGARAMQAINIQVCRSAFIVSFLVVAGLSVSLAAYAVFGATIAGSVWVIAGTLIYLLAVVLCTMAANVPMNETLAGLDAATPQAADYWAHYLSRWTRYNHIRSAGSVMAALCFSWAFVLQVQL